MAKCKGDCWTCHWCWLGRCMHGSHYGRDVSVVKDQPEECESFITREEWNKLQKPMTLNRAMELINAIINNLSVAERNKDVIQYLLHVGFTKDELIHDFNFTKDDVDDAEENMDEYECHLTFG